jgi:hypothetical protein
MTFPVWCLFSYLVQEAEERVPLSKSESIFLQPDFPGVEQLDIFAGLILPKYLVLRNMGVLRFGLAGWAHVWF